MKQQHDWSLFCSCTVLWLLSMVTELNDDDDDDGYMGESGSNDHDGW